MQAIKLVTGDIEHKQTQASKKYESVNKRVQCSDRSGTENNVKRVTWNLCIFILLLSV